MLLPPVNSTDGSTPRSAAGFLDPGASTSNTGSKTGFDEGRGCPSPFARVDGSPEASLAVMLALRASLDLAVEHPSSSGSYLANSAIVDGSTSSVL